MAAMTLRRSVAILLALLVLPHSFARGEIHLIPQSSDEAALSMLIRQYFAAYTRKDIDAIAKLWSDKTTDFAAHRKTLEKLFADNSRIDVRAVSVDRIKIDGESARAVVSVELTAVEEKTGKPNTGFGKQNRSFHFVKEVGAWKIRWEVSREAELAAELIAAKTNEERAALLDANNELRTAQLCDSLVTQGRSFAEQSNYPAALIAFQLARTVAEQIGNTKGVIAGLTGTGNVYQARGEFPTALDVYHQALKLAEANGEDAPLASLQSYICVAQQRLGNYELATEHCQRSLALAEASGNRIVVASTFNILGIIARQRGNYEQALEFYRKSLALEEELGNKRNIARLLNNLGVANNAMGNGTAALQYYLRSLPVAEELGNKAGVASTLNNISMVYRELGNYRLALEYSQRSFTLSEAIGDKAVVSLALEELGKLHAQVGEYAQALECYRKSLDLAEQTGQKVEIAICLLSLGNGYRNLGNDHQAIESYQRGLLLPNPPACRTRRLPFCSSSVSFTCNKVELPKLWNLPSDPLRSLDKSARIRTSGRRS